MFFGIQKDGSGGFSEGRIVGFGQWLGSGILVFRDFEKTGFALFARLFNAFRNRIQRGLMEGMHGFLCSRMGFLVGDSEFFGREVGVDLGGGEVCMA